MINYRLVTFIAGDHSRLDKNSHMTHSCIFVTIFNTDNKLFYDTRITNVQKTKKLGKYYVTV